MNEAQRLVLSLLQKPENRICADCKAKKSEWASTTLGVFVCIDCSGVHRSLGTHITLVRSCTLDTWTMKLANHMASIGNRLANDYWESKIPPDFIWPQAGNLSQITQFIRQKYIQKKWVADGLSPNEILDSLNKPQIPQQIKLKKKHKKINEKPTESLADRIRGFKKKNEISTKHRQRKPVKQIPVEKDEYSDYDYDEDENIEENYPKQTIIQNEQITNQNIQNSIENDPFDDVITPEINQTNEEKVHKILLPIYSSSPASSTSISTIQKQNDSINQDLDQNKKEEINKNTEKIEDNSNKNEDDDDDFYQEVEPKSEAAKAVMMNLGYSSPSYSSDYIYNKESSSISNPIQFHNHHYQNHRKELKSSSLTIQDNKPKLNFKAYDDPLKNKLLFQQPNQTTTKEIYGKPSSSQTTQNPQQNKVVKEKLDDFFNSDIDKPSTIHKTTIIRSGNRFKKAQEQQSRSKLSARLQQKINKRNKEPQLENRAPLHFAQQDNSDNDHYSTQNSSQIETPTTSSIEQQQTVVDDPFL